jgi:uncharacterized protein
MARLERLPLFLLNTVLYPEQRLPLRVFEARYMDMVTDSLKTDQPFGIVQIRSGSEVGEVAEPEDVGTLAYIEGWEMTEPGLLEILVRGGQRFAIDRVDRRGKLVLAAVQLWDDESVVRIPEEHVQMADFIRRIIQEFGAHRIAEPYRYEDASWVGLRLAQLLPVDPALKQRWLELRDPLVRLGSIHGALSELAKEDDH